MMLNELKRTESLGNTPQTSFQFITFLNIQSMHEERGPAQSMRTSDEPLTNQIREGNFYASLFSDNCIKLTATHSRFQEKTKSHYPFLLLTAS